MAKRVADTLTGGTGDVNPQFLSGSIAANNAVITEMIVNAPINRLQGAAANRTTVMEILKIFVRLSGTDGAFFYNASLFSHSSQRILAQ